VVTVRPLSYAIDLRHGGRWTSLRTPDREWLWHRPDPARDRVEPGAEFVDVGGLEECLPSVRGRPDHGAVWSRPWGAAGDAHRVSTDEFELARTIETDGGALVVDYRLSTAPGYQFVWAGHALLDVTHDALLEAKVGTRTRVYPEAAAVVGSPWPAGASWLEDAWPTPLGLPLSQLGPDDGTAIGAILLTSTVRVVDGADRLHLAVEATSQPTGIGLWRNLGGFPEGAPYRSIGVEPMVGRVFDRESAAADDLATADDDGEARWRLRIRSERTSREDR
jgi:hypothetical protein